MEAKTIKRSELYKLVWKTPLTHLAKEFNIKVHSLKNTCISHNIPLPPNGHWSRLRFSKTVEITPLPKDYQGEEEISFSEARLIGTTPDVLLSLEDRIIQEIESDPKLPTKVPDRIPKPDQLILDYKAHFESVKKYRNDRSGDYPFRKNILDITVSDEQIVRALRILDTFIKLIKARGFIIHNRNNKSYVVVESQEIEFKLKEKNRLSEKQDRWGSRNTVATGELVFIIGSYSVRTISDGKQMLENKLIKIVSIIEGKGRRDHLSHLAWEIDRVKEREKKRLEKDIKDSKDAELKRFTDIYKSALQLHHAKILRNYIEQLYQKQPELGEEWIAWARHKVDWYDPLVNSDDTMLDEGYKIEAFQYFLSFGISKK